MLSCKLHRGTSHSCIQLWPVVEPVCFPWTRINICYSTWLVCCQCPLPLHSASVSPAAGWRTEAPLKARHTHPGTSHLQRLRLGKTCNLLYSAVIKHAKNNAVPTHAFHQTLQDSGHKRHSFRVFLLLQFFVDFNETFWWQRIHSTSFQTCIWPDFTRFFLYFIFSTLTLWGRQLQMSEQHLLSCTNFRAYC